MERDDAVQKLLNLVGKDLIQLASYYGITVWKGDRINKGWAGHTLERYLGLPLNTAQAPNFGSWELKVVPLKRRKDGSVVAKETMAITMIDAVNVMQKDFYESHLYSKLKKMVICARMFESKEEKHSLLVKVSTFDLTNQELLSQIQKDYELVRNAIRTAGFQSLTGKMGIFVQPRTKGAGHGTTTRAFYARKILVEKILGL